MDCRQTVYPAIEDAAQALGSSLSCGSIDLFDVAGWFSFRANKALASMEGGDVTPPSTAFKPDSAKAYPTLLQPLLLR
ncbi:DegT/DnrJ/EryC1/StrS family aminotransferase [Paraburkholderia adhaesiva]|uniref:DegT/DnrJ/EryC1/StrS family aminotransferase n=1 Tax=Paraburkholderia adhaesiva TaxID=2883244 RepID=UPI003570DD5B